jgi:hypothetical protein
LRRQLTQMLKEGTECLNPDDIRRIIRAARSGLKGSLTAICMLDDDISLFTDADEKELREHCLSTLLEYEESMQAWEEVKNSGELDSDSDSSDDEDELTGNELLRDLDPPAPCPPADTIPTAWSGRLEWPKKVLEQTNLVSSIAAEIERNINRADWDAECYEGCQKLLQREVQRMGAVSVDRGQEEVSVLTELEVQRWVDEALENAARATKRILERFASLGVRRPDQDCGEASDFDLAKSKAAQTVMRIFTAYPLTDTQLERVVKLALGKRILEAAITTAGGGPPRGGRSSSQNHRLPSDQAGSDVRQRRWELPCGLRGAWRATTCNQSDAACDTECGRGHDRGGFKGARRAAAGWGFVERGRDHASGREEKEQGGQKGCQGGGRGQRRKISHK